MSRRSDEAEAVAEELLLELGGALARYGTPAHRLEDLLSAVARRLGQEARFFAVPTGLLAWFGKLGEQQAGMVRLDPVSTDLGKLVALDACVHRLLETGDTRVALMRLRAIVAAPPKVPAAIRILVQGLSSALAVQFFGGGLTEALVAGLVGAALGGLGVFLSRFEMGHVEAVIGASLAAAVASAAPLLLGPLREDVVTIAGLIYFLPGLTLTTAVSEVATRNLVAGTARMTSAFLVLIQLAFGVALGSQVVCLLPGLPEGPVTPVDGPAWWSLVAVVASGLCYGLLFRARARDLGVVVLSALLAFSTARLGADALGPLLGAFLGALLVGLASNLYARWFNRPALVPLVPGVLLLVPGSLGFRSVVGLLQGDTLAAVNTGFQMGLVAIALVTGLLVANGVLPPRRAL